MKAYPQKFLLFLLLRWALTQAQTGSDVINLIREGRIREAKEILNRIEKNPQQSERILFLRGLLSAEADSAVTYYEQLLKSYPDSPYSDDALFRLAQLKYAQGLYKTAQKRFQLLLEEYPRSSLHQKCYYWIGLCHQSMGQTDSAAVSFSKVVEDFSSTDLSKIAQSDLEALKEEKTAESQESTPRPKTRYSVQVYAFSSQNRALLRKDFLESKGYQVSLRTKIKEGKILYLIWLGSFGTQEEARKFGESVKKRLGLTYTLVSEQSNLF